MALLKKEIIIKPTSVMTLSQIKLAVKGIANGYQTAPTNKKTDGSFIDYFFADIYDARDGNVYRIFSDACETMYGLVKVDNYLFYTLIDKANEANNTPAETLPGGTNGENGTTTGNVEDSNYEADYPIELEWSHFCKEPISWSFDSFDRPVLLETDFTTKTVEQLQEIYGTEYTEANIMYYIKVGTNTYENSRYVPVYKTDVVEFDAIPIGVPGGEKIDTNQLFKNSAVAVTPEVKINNIVQYGLTVNTTNAAGISGLNLVRNILFGGSTFKYKSFIKINAKYLCNYRSSEEKASRQRRLVYVTNASTTSFSAATFNNVGVIAYASSYTGTLISGMFALSMLYKLHNTAQATGGKMGAYMSASTFASEQTFNVAQEKNLKIKFYKHPVLVQLTDFINVDIIKNIVLPYLNLNVPNWVDIFSINDIENIDFNVLNSELVNLYIKHKYNITVLTTTYSFLLIDIESKVLYLAVADTVDANKIFIYGKYTLGPSTFFTDAGFKTAITTKYTGTALQAYLRSDTGFTFLETPLQIINPARDILV